MFCCAPIGGAGELPDDQPRKRFLEPGDKRGGIQRPPERVLAGKGHGEPLAGAGAGDVAQIPFAGNLVERAGSQRGVLPVEFVPVGMGQNHRRGGRGGEHGFVDAQQQREFQIGIARPVHGSHEHFVQRGRNDADGQIGEAGVEHRQPLPQGHRLVGEGHGHVVEPGGHLVKNRRVQGPLADHGGQIRRGWLAPGRQRGFHRQGLP